MDATALGDKFESFMATFLARTLRSTLTEGPLAEGPVAMFADVLDEQIGAQIAKGGALRGLAENFSRGLPGADLASLTHATHASHASMSHGVRVTSGFGDRLDPIDGTRRSHHGLDLGSPSGSRIKAAAAGRVVFAGERGGYGNLVVVDHGDGTKTRYAHCRAIGVEVGQAVEAGEPIAEVGNTGRSTGPHLHFELRRDDEAVDPTEWLREHVFPLDHAGP
jgi:murein DD-endopeptidase MepM/ murein hydrolase activator NlpD